MHVVVNAATSVDGKLSTRRRNQLAISGPADFTRVDRLRAKSDAVVVGIGTVLADDPRLAVKDDDLVAAREAAGDPAHPARVVADSRARTPPDAALFDGAAAVYVLASERAPADRLDDLREAGASVVVAGEDRVDLESGFDALGDRGLDALLVEGGGELLFSLFAAGLVDELSVYVGSLVVGGADAPTLVDGEGFTEDFPSLSLRSVDRVDDGVLLSYDLT